MQILVIICEWKWLLLSVCLLIVSYACNQKHIPTEITISDTPEWGANYVGIVPPHSRVGLCLTVSSNNSSLPPSIDVQVESRRGVNTVSLRNLGSQKGTERINYWAEIGRLVEPNDELSVVLGVFPTLRPEYLWLNCWHHSPVSGGQWTVARGP